MSLRRGYKSKGSWDSERSVFNFEDEYGQDPILGRYGGSSASEELLSARAARSASEVQLAQASLDAAMRPAQVMSEFFTKMNSAVSQKADLEAKARGQAQAAQALERLGKVKDFAGYTSVFVDFPEADSDARVKARAEATRLSLQTKMLADFSNTLNSATTSDDIIRAQGSLPVEVLADTANRERIGNLVQAAEIRVKAQRATQAASAISGATGTQELLNTRMQYSDVLDDPKVRVASEIADRQSDAIRGLATLGAEAMPVTRTGQFDIDRAENIVETLGRADIRTLSAAQRGIQKQLEDPMLDPEGPEAKALQGDLTSINRQIANITNRSDQQTTRAAQDLEALGGGGGSDWIDGLIDGSAPAPATDQPAAPKPTPEPEPEANAGTPVTTASKTEEKEKPKPYDPKDRAELARLELEAQRARQEAGLMDQPAGIRQINEALAAQNAPVREKVAQLEAAQQRINPFAEANARDAQTIQAALDVVYPEMDGGGFDVGSSDDPRVVSAAEFLRRVDPSLLRMVASAPGSNRAGLTFEELSDIAAKATRSPRGRKAK